MLTQILGLEKNDPKIIGPLFAYLFGRINKAQYKEAIGDKAKAKEIWLKTSTSGYITKNCKLFAYAVHHNRLHRIPTSPAKFGIVQEDVAILRRLNLTHIKKPHKAYSLFDFDNLEGSILKSKELRDYIGKFISKKMMYLMRSYGQDRSDLYDHMQHAALLALRKHYPFYHSDLHALNICKTSVHNSGVGIMEFWDRAKRKALMQDGSGYQAVKVPLESVVGVGVEPEHACEFRNNIKSLVSLSTKLKPKALAFVSAAAGLYDPGFSMFLGLDNTDAAEKWDYARYLTLLRTYYQVSEEQTTRLFTAIRKHLL